MSDPQAELRRRLRQLNPGQLRRVILALDLTAPGAVRAAVDEVDHPTILEVEGQLELDG